MTATRYTLHTPAAIALWRAGIQACRTLVRTLRRSAAAAWLHQHQVRSALRGLRELNTMNDRQLRDLGIDRSELLSLAWNPDDATRMRFIRRL